MKIEPDICYQALLSRDARFDGRFFTGVSSTGIYCRPVCPAKTPKRENCTFYSTPAGAEAAGYRPCLRCRPELAPSNAGIDASARLAEAAASLIEDQPENGDSLRDLANRLGVTDRHLRRVFQAEFGVSPVQAAQTRRLLLAKRLLTDTNLPVIDVALASGFRSLRRFNALFRGRYRLNPTQLRKAKGDGLVQPESLVFHLRYRPPFDWHGLLEFLGHRAIQGVEQADGTAYRRSVGLTVSNRMHRGWIEVRPAASGDALEVRLGAGLAGAVPAVLSRVKRLFDLACRPDVVAKALGPLASDRPGLRVPGAFDGFELAVRAILGQQVTVKAARTLAGRFAAAFGEPVEAPFPEVKTVFPSPGRIAALEISDIAELGIVAQRAKAIIALALALDGGLLKLEPGADVDSAVKTLLAVPGVGPWTAQYVAMRALSWPDAFPAADYGVMKALNEKNPARVLEMAEAWRPWRAYAVMHLWASL